MIRVHSPTGQMASDVEELNEKLRQSTVTQTSLASELDELRQRYSECYVSLQVLVLSRSLLAKFKNYI